MARKNLNAEFIKNRKVSDTPPVNGQAITYNSSLDEYEHVSPAGGGDMLGANNLSDVASAATSRTNIGAVNIAGDTMTGKLIGFTPTISAATFKLPSGVDPTTPVEGDLWYNGTQLYFRNATVNKDLLAGGGDMLGANNLSDVASAATSRTNIGAVNIAGDTMTGKLTGVASTTATATYKIPLGVDPTTPTEGDLWYNGTQLYFRNGTANKDLLIGGDMLGANNLSDVASAATSRTNIGAVNIAGDTMTGKLTGLTPTTAAATFKLPNGVDPTTPVEGDFWYNGTNLYFRDATTNQDLLAGGGGGASQFDATVGATGADFTTLQAAVAAGKKSLLVIDNTTETVDTAVPSGGLYIYIMDGVILDMGAKHFTYTSVADVFLRGQGKIKTTTTAGGLLFANTSFLTSVVDIDGIIWDNNPSSIRYLLADGSTKLRNFTIEMGNFPGALGTLQASSNHIWDNIHFIGGGTNSYECVELGVSSIGNIQINNVSFVGTFNSTLSLFAVRSSEGTVDNIIYDGSNNAIIILGCTTTNVKSISKNLSVLTIKTDISFSNFNLVSGNFTIGANRNFLSNINTNGSLIFTTGTDCYTSNSYFGSTSAFTLTTGRNRNYFSNTTFLGNITLQSNSNQHVFTGCRLDSGVTLNTNSQSNIFTGCRITGTITDNGTGNIFNDGISRNGDMHIHANAIPTVIDTVNTPHMVQGLFVADLLSNFTFVAGSTGAITVMAAGVNTTITSTAHGLVNGDVVSISGTTSYNGVFIISAVTANTFDISAVFVANDATGSWYKGDALKVSTGSGGRYKLNFNGYGNLVSGNNKFFLYEVYINGIPRPVVESRRKYNSAGDIGSFGGGGNVDIVDGDVICLAITGQTDLSNFIFEHVNVSLHKIG